MVVERTVYQPLNPSIRERLDPEYVAFHDDILQYIIPSEDEKWDPASRFLTSPIALGGQKEAEVGKVEDRDLGNFQIRVFTPEGVPPKNGWPVLMWLHGGGWVNGGLSSENGYLRHVCKYVKCVVISVNYRHAPEDPYPAAIDDAFEGLQWILSPENASSLGIDTSRMALGGLSAGGCLTAIISMKAALTPSLPTQPVSQLLICPVIDNTATTETVWATSQYSPWLTPSRMQWYRKKYFQNPDEEKQWNASPCFATPDILAKSPKTFLAVAECDLLAPEALNYGDLLKKNGVDTEIHVYPGATHSVLILAGIHKIGKQLVHDSCSTLAKELGTEYDPTTAPVISQQG